MGRFHNTFADPSLHPAAAALDTEDCFHTLPVDRHHKAVGDTAADVDVHMQEEEVVVAAGGILHIDSAAGGVGSHRLEAAGPGAAVADVHNCHEVQ